MQPESIIKGRIAGLIVSLMFQEAGYTVFRYGYEGVPESLAQIGNLEKRKALDLILNTPHFTIVDKKEGETFLVGVRFQGSSTSGRNIPYGYEKMIQLWPVANLIVVQTTDPYFFILKEGGGKLQKVPLVDAKLFKVGKVQIKKYGLIARKFLS